MVMGLLLRRYAVTIGFVALGVGGVSCSTSSSSSRPPLAPTKTFLVISTLSNRADLISGGDALVEIGIPGDATPDGLHVTVGSRDVTSAFAVRADGRVIGLITGLAEGPNKVTADLAGDHASFLMITNHKIGGPVISGEQVKPFVCATPNVSVVDPATGAQTTISGLSTPAIDDQCNIPTEIKLYYRTTTAGCSNALPDPNPPTAPPGNPCFKPYDPSAAAPVDLAMTTTDTGATVPYIVRDERGTLNRGIYDIAVLFDPTKDDPKTGWKPTAPQAGWNGKVVYSFGASSGQPRLQLRSEQTWTDDSALSRGFLVAINSMTDSLFNSNRTVMTETLMMMKEKVIDSFGEVKYMIGNGCSGGSINQLTAASIFPGLLDGIQPTCTYPDSETTGMEVTDCLQLLHAYSSSQWQALMNDSRGLALADKNAKMTAINGSLDIRGCQSWVTSFASAGRPGQYVPFAVDQVNNVLVPSTAAPRNNCFLPAALVYDKTNNPTGVRCSSADAAAAIFGYVTDDKGKVIEPKRARSTADNTGVQYGLKALRDGAITPEEFVVVNEQAGGVDADSDFTLDNSRTAGDPIALATAYRAGIVSDGKHLAKTAIIDLRGWDEQGIHYQWRSFSLRARLDAANGNHNNHVLWRFGTGLLAPTASGMTLDSFLMMDKWLSGMKKDPTAAVEGQVIAAKPKDAFDYCYLTSDTTFSTKVKDFSVCDTDPRLKPHASPRQVAGGPLAEDILKCQLKKLDPADYAPAVLTAAQIARLQAVFPDGVCDFSKPGVGQQPAVSPLDFSGGPGGVELGSPPGPKVL
jgi:uncharacterized tannase-like protein DUF6351